MTTPTTTTGGGEDLWRRFLGVAPRQVLPSLGGEFVEGDHRRLRIEAPAGGPLPRGWWTFEVKGHAAWPLAPARRPDLTHLPAVRGHATDGYLVGRHGRADRLEVVDGEPPPRFAPVVARRWPGGGLLVEVVDLDDDAETATRARFERREPLAGVHGVPASLRAAFAYATCLRMAREWRATVTPACLRGHVGALADRGDAAAAEILAELTGRPAPAQRAAAPLPDALTERAAAAVRFAGGELIEVRHHRDGVLEVRWRYDWPGGPYRLSTLVDRDTFRVEEAGVCLDDRDRRQTLWSLPSVVREGLERGLLYITRHL